MNARQYELLRKEADRIVNAFASYPNSRQRAVTKVTKLVLLGAPYMLRGRLRDIKSKSLGAGVYELSLKEVE